MGEKAMGCERAIQLRLDEDTMRLLDEQASRRGYPTSALIKLIIAQWLVAQPPRPDSLWPLGYLYVGPVPPSIGEWKVREDIDLAGDSGGPVWERIA